VPQSTRRCRSGIAADMFSDICMEHLFVANQVLSNESQVIPSIQVLVKKPLLHRACDLWVIESKAGRLPLQVRFVIERTR
jgi:hypothetical protein